MTMRSARWVTLWAMSVAACATSAGGTPRPTVQVQQAVVQHGTSEVSATVVQGAWMQASPLHTRLHVGAQGETYLGVWIDAPMTTQDATRRAPLDVALVVDTSGSMSGEKIHHARLAASSFIDGLAEGDIVSLYSFSSEVTELAPPTVVTATSRAALLQRVASLYAAGGTNLYGGLETATQAAAQAPPTHPVRRVVMISDGRGNIGPATAEALGDLAARATENGTQVTAIGVGLDYDEGTLGALAVRSAGRLYHLESPQQMASILHDELELLGQTVAANAALELDAAPGVVFEGTDNLRVDRQGQRLRVPLGALHGGQHREVLVRVRVPTTRAAGPLQLGTARLAFDDPAAQGARRNQEVALTVTPAPDAETQAASANARVVAMVTRYEAAQSQQRAARLLNEGQAQQAEQELQRAEERLRRAATQYEFADTRVQGQLLRQAASVSAGRAATRRAIAAPSAAATRGASLQNNADAMHSFGY